MSCPPLAPAVECRKCLELIVLVELNLDAEFKQDSRLERSRESPTRVGADFFGHDPRARITSQSVLCCSVSHGSGVYATQSTYK